MKERQYREYTQEFKLEALELLKRGDKSASQVEQELGITPGLLVKWMSAIPDSGKRRTTITNRTKRYRSSQGRDSTIAAKAGRSRGRARNPKKSSQYLLTKKRMKYKFMSEHEDEFSVKRMCHVLQVQRSGYYAWKQRPVSAQEKANQELLGKIKSAFTISRNTYGSVRIRQYWAKKGQIYSRHRIARLMKHVQLVPLKAAKWHPQTTKQKKWRQNSSELFESRVRRIPGRMRNGWSISLSSTRLKVGCIWLLSSIYFRAG